MLADFHQTIKKSLAEKDKSLHLKKLFLYLEKDPLSSYEFWSVDEIPFLILQELTTPFSQLSLPEIENKSFADVITVLNILQIIVTDKNVREDFLNAQYPFYIYPYLNTNSLNNQFESLRIAGLGVIGQLLKDDDKKTALYLQNTEIVPLTLKIMDIGSVVSKKIATYIFLKIIGSDEGLEYACQTFERFIAISVILNSMVMQLLENMDKNLLKSVLRCYVRLVNQDNVRISYASKPPEALYSREMAKIIEDDKDIRELFSLFKKIINNSH
ncbi:hypothetical protein VCUG_00216 [Vavraia culicis subsp. floridensis]|uniref:Cell differentiation protein rcd1 n=1 Tax=Vavraia culicis (isolate floridensis) TaxID=948595 RepID=L2GZ87_VAVCU|nr:uncharacterized protein VCUG_00216 [Vavraia culicis subsp. floridensis]ELA48380.1 hypothetical protein VCUG_00216 [Vavraia culicis subsp. floridensis]